MKKNKFMIFFLFFLSTIFLFTFDAVAKKTLDIKNETGSIVNVAVRYLDYREGRNNGLWATIGWYNVKPWEEITVNLYTDESTVYIYAYNNSQRWVGSKSDSRDLYFWVSPKSMYLHGKSVPKDEGAHQVLFKRYHLPKKDYKITYRNEH